MYTQIIMNVWASVCPRFTTNLHSIELGEYWILLQLPIYILCREVVLPTYPPPASHPVLKLQLSVVKKALSRLGYRQIGSDKLLRKFNTNHHRGQMLSQAVHVLVVLAQHPASILLPSFHGYTRSSTLEPWTCIQIGRQVSTLRKWQQNYAQVCTCVFFSREGKVKSCANSRI